MGKSGIKKGVKWEMVNRGKKNGGSEESAKGEEETVFSGTYCYLFIRAM